jgi:hypothetical protein
MMLDQGLRPSSESRVPLASRASLERALERAARDVRMLAAVTPANLKGERARLLSALERGHAPLPRFVYAPVARTELRRALEVMARMIPSVVGGELGEVYRARVEELDLEAQIAEASGTHRVGELAHARFGERDGALRAEAVDLANGWLRIPPSPAASSPRAPSHISDADDPESLLSQMRRRIGIERLPFRVEVNESLSSRAATGERTIWVCKGRLLTKDETRRAVVHEIFGHASPRARATRQIPIFSIGTARGADDQEGLALLVEERAGLLDESRRLELAARHWAVERMGAGASFADVALPLVSDYGFSNGAALGVAERAFRGSDGQGAGLGRERVYIGAWLRVHARLARCPCDEDVLASGQVAVDAVDALSALHRGR